ncbi:MAG: thioredoxin fold domain-containing protein [Merismopedia sp. SIO2A8]|nr:thioredoxin fold domain-containing protein [Merismopedia sp. SIO2A8]
MTSSQPPSSKNPTSQGTANSPTSTPATGLSAAGTKVRNGLIAVVAIILSVALFFGINNPSGENTLAALAESSTPLAMAEGNGKPTLMEFYADWCTTCQAMAPDLKELKQGYGDRLNFVMLNVDNTKWLPELAEYRVDGIPHFVFINGDGEAIASVIGEQPRTIMAANLEALTQGESLPYLTQVGQTSVVEAPSTTTAINDNSRKDDPRNHGG